MRKNSLLPIINNNTRVLIVGSMPSEKSLAAAQYYGNKRNHFWPIMSALFGEQPQSYDARIAWLLSHRIGLWDAIESCERTGSLDSSIRAEVPNDFPTLFAKYPALHAIVFNGTKAEAVFKKHIGFQLLGNRRYVRLPSTSPIPGKYNKTLEQKIESWQIVKQLL